jgi:antitoxin (DNA-binding transcriptional repressor) of toxin-antitoxin stability system
MTIQVTKDEAIQQIEELLKKAESGDEILIAEEGKLIASIEPPKSDCHPEETFVKDGKRIAGSAKGQFIVPDEFFDPLPDDIVDSFYK